MSYSGLEQIYEKVRAETNEKQSFSDLAMPNRLLSS